MIVNFADQGTEDLYHGINSKAARAIPRPIWSAALRKLDMLNAAHDLKDLLVPPGNRLEALSGNLKGYHSVRVNDQYRILFVWSEGNARKVKIVDYH